MDVGGHFQFARKHGGRPEFIERKLPEIAPRPSPPTPVVRTEQPRTPAVVQVTLPLFDAPADKPADKTKEAFVWGEFKGIEGGVIHLHYNRPRRTSHACERIGTNAD